MYYLYKKSRGVQLPTFHYRFNDFSELYELANVTQVSIFGAYYINIKSDDYKAIVNFIDVADSYSAMFIYVEVNESLLEYIRLTKPNVQLLQGASNYEVFKELISKYEILFAKGCIDTMYFAIGHEYEEMEEALILLRQTYPNVSPITDKEISSLFVVDNLIYPRSVLIMFLRLDRGRWRNLDKCVDHFGNDLVMFSMRKTVRKFFTEKLAYLKSGVGRGLIKTIPIHNIILMLRVLDYERMGFKEIKSLMEMYEKGDSVYDFVHEGANPYYDEKFDAPR